MSGVVVGLFAAVPAAETVTPVRLRVAVVQVAMDRTIAENRDRILAGVARAASSDARVAVFPEGALVGTDGDDAVVVDEAVEAIRAAAREKDV
jgi:predicted amidohydrolase